MTWPTVPVPDDRQVPPREVVQRGLCVIVDRLVLGDYVGLCEDGLARRTQPEGLRAAVATYGRTLTALPAEAFGLTELGPITLRPDLWWLVQPLWTVEEGRSDLDIVGGVAHKADGTWLVYVDDLRVQ